MDQQKELSSVLRLTLVSHLCERTEGALRLACQLCLGNCGMHITPFPIYLCLILHKPNNILNEKEENQGGSWGNEG